MCWLTLVGQQSCHESQGRVLRAELSVHRIQILPTAHPGTETDEAVKNHQICRWFAMQSYIRLLNMAMFKISRRQTICEYRCRTRGLPGYNTSDCLLCPSVNVASRCINPRYQGWWYLVSIWGTQGAHIVSEQWALGQAHNLLGKVVFVTHLRSALGVQHY
jgi:hypothetical protein